MGYINADTMIRMANFLEDFDEESLISVFKSQIFDEYSYSSIPINQLYPLYVKFQKATNYENVDEDDISELRKRYYNICKSVIDNICTKFDIEVDYDWICDKYSRLSAVAMSMYRFFVIDFFYIVLGVLNNYIASNTDELFTAFSDTIQKKDVSTITNLRIMNPEYAVIVSSLYDVTDYIFSMLDNETFFMYITKDYVIGNIISKMIENNYIIGDFVRKFADIYKENLQLRSKITFELAYRIKEHGYLPINPIIDPINENIENTTDDSMDVAINPSNNINAINTDIDDDVDET